MVEPLKPMDAYICYPDGRSCDDFKNEKTAQIYKDSIADQEGFWSKRAELSHWSKKWTQTLDTSDKYLHRWFPDGEINMCYNAVDCHVKEGRGDNIAFLEDSAYTGKKEKWTYKQVHEMTGKLASIFKKKFGIQTGDRILIYMPMVVESAVAMLACARIGAIHSVVFGGFAAKELASRIDDCSPRLIVTSSCGIEPGKHIKYVPIIEESLTYCEMKDATKIPRLLHQRLELGGKLREDKVELKPEFYSDFKELIDAEKDIADCVAVKATHPLYILYTSGTTGSPKGIVRDTGGTVVGLNFCMENVFNVHIGSVHFAGSDIGWVVGHSFIVYGPLIRGATSVFFEGKPITPDAGAVWRRVEEYKVTSLYMAPTAVRVVKKEDYDGEWIKKYNTKSINSFALVGERCDPDTIKWINRHFPHVIINDTWWQTETGWPICCNLLNEKVYGKVYPTLPGSVTRAIPGYDVQVLDDENNVCEPGQLGKVVIKMPLPPSFMLTLWGNDAAFIEKYLADTPGFYTTGDAGLIDREDTSQS
jgi:propionyl-CoA synthetase